MLRRHRRPVFSFLYNFRTRTSYETKSYAGEMSVVTVGSIQSNASCVKHLSGPKDASDVFYGQKCVLLLHWKSCGHCLKFLPVYEKTAESKRNIKFYALEVTRAEPESEMPEDQFFKDSGVPRVAVVERGQVLDTVKGDNEQGFLAMLGKFFGVK